MNNVSLKTVSEMTNLLHVCLAKAIDMAMTEKSGENWFESFRDYDQKQKDPVLEDAHTSVNKMDLQSCLKFLRFRDDYANIVFDYFGYNFFDKSEDAKTAKFLMMRLLDSLIHNVRNRLLAHASTNMVEGGTDDDMRFSIYGPKEAANDCLRLAQVFEKVTDESGVSFYAKMIKLTEAKQEYSVPETIKSAGLALSTGTFVEICNKNKISVVTGENGEMFFLSSNYDGDIAKIKLYVKENYKNTKTYAIADVISAENLGVSTGDFVEACQTVGIAVSTMSNGALVFSTSNYDGDLAKIKLHFTNKAPVVTEPEKKSTFPWKPVIAILLVALIAVIAIFVIKGADSDNEPTDSSRETNQYADNDSDSDAGNVVVTPEEDDEEEDTTEAVTEPVNRITAEKKYGTVTFTINQEPSDEIVINFENGNLSYSFGWVNTKPTYTVTTVSGETYQAYSVNYSGLQPLDQLGPNSSGQIQLFFEGIDEPIEKITITNFIPLDDRGLPSEYVTLNIEMDSVE